MKKLIFVSALSLMSCLALGQAAIDQVMMDQARKDKEKSDKSIQDPKSNVKAATWMERAKTYENIALQYTQIDSSAALTAYEAYKKVVELDLTKKGEPGRISKEAQAVLDGAEGTNLYNAFVKQGAEKYQSQNMIDALKMFQMAQQINSKDTLAALYGGISAQQADKKEEAVSQFETYITNGGKDPSVYYGLAQLYRSDNNFDKAVNTLERGLEKNADNKDLKSEIVNIYLASGKEEEAIKQLKDVIAKDPSSVQNLVNLAILYDNSGIKLSGKIRDLEEKVSGSSKKSDQLTKQIEDEKGKLEVFEGEVKRLTARLKAQPKSADLKRQLGEVTATRDETKTNLAKYEADLKALAANAANSDNAAAEKELADLKGQYTESRNLAIETYKKALEVDPNNYDALFNLGVFYFNDAVELKREVDNMNMQEYQQRGKEVEGRVCGRFKKAQPFFEKAVKIRDDEDAKSTLENLNNVLTQFEGKNVTCIQE
ncbi:tetratricopeptide repeat protein [Arundinibacter roseus]|uniref:Tetratricopeptide repeat protein n=1 Tax=Arundinibacter roseus TaxID=2070510 RepID=A0A4R4KK49_9BACT|nr:tetratricopeptide repeat protein [Arundinibacter roseus]TDB66951.1 tetratricopeptide repeat protein [Arundinibacter roseus]